MYLQLRRLRNLSVTSVPPPQRPLPALPKTRLISPPHQGRNHISCCGSVCSQLFRSRYVAPHVADAVASVSAQVPRSDWMLNVLKVFDRMRLVKSPHVTSSVICARDGIKEQREN